MHRENREQIREGILRENKRVTVNTQIDRKGENKKSEQIEETETTNKKYRETDKEREQREGTQISDRERTQREKKQREKRET